MRKIFTILLFSLALLLLSVSFADQVTFAEPSILELICIQNGFDAYDITEEKLQGVIELNITMDKHGYQNIYNLSMVDLQYLPNLETLRIIPSYEMNIDMKGINRCQKLRVLEIRNCRFNDLERIADLPVLEELSISSGWGEGLSDYSPLSNLTNLRKLSLAWYGYNAYNEYGLKDASSISNLVNLEELTVSYVSVNGYSIAEMPKLKKVDLPNYDAQALFDQLYESGAWRNLEYLKCNVRSMEPQVLASLGRLNQLKYLYLNIDIYGSSTNLNGIENLNQLETLIIPDIPYKIDNMDAIGEITTLKDLQINYDADQCPLGYINNLTELRNLKLGAYKDISLSQFSNLKKLETVELNYCGGSNWNNHCIDLSGVESLPNLKEITYYGYKIKSTMPLDDYPEIELTEKHLTW